MEEKLKKIWDWLVWSSADPNRVAMTVKGALSLAVGYASYIAIIPGLHNVTSGDLQTAVDLIGAIVSGGLLGLGAFLGVWGAIRKLYNTFVK